MMSFFKNKHVILSIITSIGFISLYGIMATLAYFFPQHIQINNVSLFMNDASKALLTGFGIYTLLTYLSPCNNKSNCKITNKK